MRAAGPEDFTGRTPPHLLHCLGSSVKPLQVPGVNVHTMLESKLQADRLVLCQACHASALKIEVMYA